MTVVTRFAPSPTGFLHIGGARTALFNWLFARHHGGKFLLRVEDTDRARSTEAAVAAIFDGLIWLGLEWDDEPVFQSARAARHIEVVDQLLAAGHAYHCYCSPEELADMRAAAKERGEQPRYDGRWRDRDPSEAPPGIKPVVRLKAPQSGETVIDDRVQGPVTVANSQLDDMILLRADRSPTYMLSVVVDDHDMSISHVIRGDDHLNNAFRQVQIYQAIEWTPPTFAHIPLIHGSDGAKLSKRHGALGVEAYRDLGILPAAMRNYLLRLGWSHGDAEIIDTDQAIGWFDLDAVNRGAARFDMARLESLNGHYIHEAGDDELADLIMPRLADATGAAIDQAARQRLRAGMTGLKARATTLVDLAEKARFYVAIPPLDMDPKAAKLLDETARNHLVSLRNVLAASEDWTAANLEHIVREFAESKQLKLGKIAQPLRAALTGSTASPGIFEVMAVLGREQVLLRLETI